MLVLTVALGTLQMLPAAFQPATKDVIQALKDGLEDQASYAASTTRPSPFSPQPEPTKPWTAEYADKYLETDQFNDPRTKQIVKIQLITNCWQAYLEGLTRLPPGFFQGTTTEADRNAVVSIFTSPATGLRVRLLSTVEGGYSVSLENQSGKSASPQDAELTPIAPPDPNSTDDTDLMLAELQQYNREQLSAAAAFGQPVGGIVRCRLDFSLTAPDGSSLIQPSDKTLTVVVRDSAGALLKRATFPIDQ